MIGIILFFIVLASVLHYSGAFYSQYLPMSDSNTYDNTGKPYDVSRILSADYTLDVEAYNNYSPLFLRYDAQSLTSSVKALLTRTAPLLPSPTVCPLLPSPR